GPEHWHKHYPIAKGDNQSPIEINSKEVHYDPSLLPWFVGYDPVGARTIVNNGRTCKVVFDDTFNRSVLRNGPLPGIYRLRQLHFHWGSSNDHGSEHIVDGVKYAGELHLVHWYSKYSNYAEALRNYDGVAILGIFLQVGKTQKPEMKRILEEINGIKTKGKEVPFSNFDPSILFPKSWDYWTYHGSLTEPPCDECVTWILLRDPIIVSPDQRPRWCSCMAEILRANFPVCSMSTWKDVLIPYALSHANRPKRFPINRNNESFEFKMDNISTVFFQAGIGFPSQNGGIDIALKSTKGSFKNTSSNEAVKQLGSYDKLKEKSIS
ncbi:hypothetical protein KIL84_012056, partial [Mauremys mutica]